MGTLFGITLLLTVCFSMCCGMIYIHHFQYCCYAEHTVILQVVFCHLMTSIYCYLKQDSSLSFTVEDLLLFQDEQRSTPKIHTHNKNRNCNKHSSLGLFSVLLSENVLLLRCRETLKVVSEVLYHRLYLPLEFYSFPWTSLHCPVILRDVSVLWKGKRTL